MHLNTKEIEMTTFNNPLETWIGSGKFDNAKREIGYIVGTNDNGEQYAAWVQNGRKANGKFADFGVAQRSKMFASQEQATRWAYTTAKERIAKL
jgi:hypothetical protein